MKIFTLFRIQFSKISDKMFRYKRMGFCGKNVFISFSARVTGIHNLYMYDNTNIFADAKIICTRAKFIMKKNSGAAAGLTVVTGGHMSMVGKWFKSITDNDKDLLDKDGREDEDIIVEEDVWIATNVTLLKGLTIGRGSVIGSGAVCRRSVPPYAIVIGNPAKIVGFKFTPEEVIKHEQALYTEPERLSLEYLQKNYNKYFIHRIKEIKDYLRN